MEKKDFKNWNWDDTGLLCDLKGDAYDTVKKYLKEIDFDKVDDGESYSCIVPVVRKIISSIIDGERQFGYFKNKTSGKKRDFIRRSFRLYSNKRQKKYKRIGGSFKQIISSPKN